MTCVVLAARVGERHRGLAGDGAADRRKSQAFRRLPKHFRIKQLLKVCLELTWLYGTAAVACCYCRQEGDDDSHQWQKTLYKKIGSRKAGDEESEPSELDLQSSVNTVLAMAKVLHGLHLVSATRHHQQSRVH